MNFSEWGQVLGDDVLATAILDRLLHHCEAISLNGPNYQLKDHVSPKGGEPRHQSTGTHRLISLYLFRQMRTYADNWRISPGPRWSFPPIRRCMRRVWSRTDLERTGAQTAIGRASVLPWPT